MISRTILASLLLLLLLPFGLWGASRGLGSMTNHPLQWISGGSDSSEDFEWFSEVFEHYDPIVISWEGATPDDQRITQLVAGLKAWSETPPRGRDRSASASGSLKRSAALSSEGPLFREVTSGKQLWNQLLDDPYRFSEAEAYDRLGQFVIGPQAETMVIALLSDQATLRSKEALEVIYATAASECGLSREQVHLGGPTVESVAIDAASIKSRYQKVLPSGLAVLLVAWPCLRSLTLTMYIGVLAGICEMAALGAVHFFGSPFTGLLVVMPALLFVVFISGAVHFCNYFYDSIDEGRIARAAPTAMRVGWFPCSLAACTTAVGIFSLGASYIEPVRVFASYAGAGVVFALLVLLSTIPGAVHLLATSWLKTRRVRSRTNRRRPKPVKPGNAGKPPWWATLSAERPWLVFVVFTLACFLCGWGLQGLRPTMDQADFFAEDSKTIRDIQWLEKHIGPLMPLEIAIPMPDDGGESFGDRVRLIGQIAREVRDLSAVGSCMSLASLAPDIDEGSGFGAVIRRRAVLHSLRQQRDDLLGTGYVAMNSDEEVWRISVRVATGFDHNQVIERVRQTVIAAAASFDEFPVDIDPIVTGLFVLIADSRQRLLSELTISFGIALMVIAVTLTLTFRSLTLGVASIIPNVFPTLAVFGTMGWFGADIDVGAMITASVGLGIAVDDTVHYLAWYTRALQEGATPKEAVVIAYRRCAGAMMRTTLICSAGLIVFLFSPLVLAARFASMICVLLIAAIIGDLIFLPAILCGPLAWYRRRAAMD